MSEMSSLPIWLQELWKENPRIARTAEKWVEEKFTTTNNARQQALREIAGDIDCWIRRVNQVGDLVPVHTLKAWHRQLQPLL